MANIEVYEVPGSIEEIFENPEESWRIIDYELPGMDCSESLDYFLELAGIGPDCIIQRDTESVVLGHPGYPFKVRLGADDLGDLHSHVFEANPE